MQGVGAAVLLPQTLSLVVDVFPAGKRGAALGVWGVVAGVSGAAGPTVGGLLVTRLDWRWIFYVNVPLGVLAAAGAVLLIPAPVRTVRHRFDVPGVLLSSAALLLLALGLIEGQRYDWNGWVLASLGASAVLAAVFLRYQRGRQDSEPLVPFSLFRDRNFTVVNVVGIAMSFGVVGLFLPLTVYLQSVLGLSALRSGLVLLPLSVGTFVTAGPASVLAVRLGGRWVLMAGLSLFGGGLAWIAAVADVGGSWTALPAPLFMAGVGAGCTFSPMAAEVMRNVPPQPHRRGVGRQQRAAAGGFGARRRRGRARSSRGGWPPPSRTRPGRGRARYPPAFRTAFLRGFDHAGRHLNVAGGTSGARLPAGLPAAQAHRLQDTSAAVFGHGFVDAMRPTLLLSVAVMAAGALTCLFVRRFGAAPADPHGLPLTAGEIAAAEAS